MYMLVVHRGQKRVLDSVELALQMVVSPTCEYWELNPGLLLGQQVLFNLCSDFFFPGIRHHFNPDLPRTHIVFISKPLNPEVTGINYYINLSSALGVKISERGLLCLSQRLRLRGLGLHA